MKSKSKAGEVLVVGSLGIDMIFSVHGEINKKIQVKNGKLQKQNLMFVANERKEFLGGTGGNIAYGLGLLGVKPLVFSLAGKDFLQNYDKHLSKIGVCSRVVIDKNRFTANFYGISDAKNEQIGIWQPNAYEEFEHTALRDKCTKNELENIKMAIFSPGTPQSTFRHMIELRKHSPLATIFFDPGQMVTSYTKRLFLICIALSDIVIVNDVEYVQAGKVLGKNLTKLCKESRKVLIVTRGSNGSEIFAPDYIARIPAFTVKKVIDPTGAGDAYRAGLISKLISGSSLTEAAMFASRIASHSVKFEGSQNYILK